MKNMNKITFTIMILGLVLLSACDEVSETKITDFESCVAAGNPVMESFPRQCQANGKTYDEDIDYEKLEKDNAQIIDEDGLIVGDDKDEHGCIGSAGYQWCPSTDKCQRMWEEYCEEYKEQYRAPIACTREYMPVCGLIQVQCVTTPCDPLPTTYSNKCMAEAAGATDITEGVCGLVELKEICENTEGANWVEGYNECEYLSEDDCNSVSGRFFECGSACRNDPVAEACTMQCVPYCAIEEN